MSAAELSVVVLAGGLSGEREVSLQSGHRVVGALHDVGIAAQLQDLGDDLVERLLRDRPDVVWPVLHGADGEDGSLSQVLELLDLPFVGSSAEACRLAWDKSVAGALVAESGVAVPRAVTLPHAVLRDLGTRELLPRVSARLGEHVVVKPVTGGSSLGVTVVQDSRSLATAMAAALGHADTCRVEQAVVGTEVAVGVVDAGDGPDALLPVEISPDSGSYDYEARYTPGSTEFHTPARLPADVLDQLRAAAVTVHRLLGLGHLSRSDFIVDAGGVPWFLEVNTAPGLTETSSVPLALDAAGLALPRWCRALVTAATSAEASPAA